MMTRKMMKPSETSATRSWRKRRQNSASGERAATSPSPSRNSSPAPATGSDSTAPTLTAALPGGGKSADHHNVKHACRTSTPIHRRLFAQPKDDLPANPEV